MKKQDDAFLERLLSTFRIEAAEHIRALSAGLIELENVTLPGQQGKIVETVFREVHSLKGAARAVSHIEIEAVCQSMESVFSALKAGKLTLSSGMLDVLHHGVDSLEKSLSLLEADAPAGEKPEVTPLLREIEGLLKGGQRLEEQDISVQRLEPEIQTLTRVPLHEESLKGSAISASTETVRIPVSRLESLLLQAEELLSAKLTAGQRKIDMQHISSAVGAWRKEWRKIHADFQTLQRSFEKNKNHERPDTEKLQIAKVLEFLQWNQAHMRSVEGELIAIARSATQDHRSIAAMVDNLLDDTKKILMVPFSSVLEIFPRLVRELSRDQGKEIELTLQGGEVEADRRILEEMKDPLIHLVRNCVDHGVEKPNERERKRKPHRGSITITVSQKNGDKVEIAVADDGAGIDVAKVRSAALKLDVISSKEGQELGDQEVLSLIFQSGISTSPLVTDVSGRGLGLAIVREKVERLGGVITFDARVDVGTTFRIVLPLTLAAFRGLLVRLGELLFVLPTLNVERVALVKKDEIKTVENRETIQMRGETLSLVRLNKVLEVPKTGSSDEACENHYVVILASAGKHIAFLVDEVLQEQEVLVKNLGPQLPRVRNMAGATVLGNGRVVPILNPPELMKSAVRATLARLEPVAVAVKKGEEKKKSILVVEDSITARTLLKNILEMAGYDVATAIDGVDAFTQLRTNEFDVVLSDVDMPRMNGLDLTARIREEKKFAELPVVLLTALESREDRERGVDVGANAYLVKSSFDQSNLLEVLQKLV